MGASPFCRAEPKAERDPYRRDVPGWGARGERPAPLYDGKQALPEPKAERDPYRRDVPGWGARGERPAPLYVTFYPSPSSGALPEARRSETQGDRGDGKQALPEPNAERDPYRRDVPGWGARGERPAPLYVTFYPSLSSGALPEARRSETQGDRGDGKQALPEPKAERDPYRRDVPGWGARGERPAPLYVTFYPSPSSGALPEARRSETQGDRGDAKQALPEARRSETQGDRGDAKQALPEARRSETQGDPGY